MDIVRKSEKQQADFYGKVSDLGSQALAKTGRQRKIIRVARTIVQLDFAGEAILNSLFPALAHLEYDGPETPGAVFTIWDSATSGVAMIPPPFKQDEFTDRGDIWGCDSKRYRLTFHWSDYSVNVFDRDTRLGSYWVQDHEKLPYWSKSSPLRTLFHWWMELNGCQLLHAAAVGHADGAVLITGKGGVGKSTTSLTCLKNGLKYIADDYMIVGLDPDPTAFSLYSTAKLNPDQVVKFPELGQHITNRDSMQDEKATLYLYPALEDRIEEELPLKTVLTPSFNDADQTEIGPISQTQLVGAAAFTTMSQLPYVGEENHKLIVRLVESLPGFELKLGRDLDGVAAKLNELSKMDIGELNAMDSKTDTEDGADWPLISVVMPVYNGSKFIPEAVDNILSQNYPALEIILVDDGSQEDIKTVVDQLPVDVRYFRQENQGPAAARNWGIKDASGEYIAFLDVDDLWPENTLFKLLEVHREKGNLEVVHGHAQLMELDEETGAFNYTGNPEEAFPYYIGAGLYRKTAFEKNGLFDSELMFAEDSDWYNRAREIELPVLRHESVTLLVRRHGGNMTAGKTEAELNPLLAFKKALDRRRARQQAEEG